MDISDDANGLFKFVHVFLRTINLKIIQNTTHTHTHTLLDIQLNPTHI